MMHLFIQCSSDDLQATGNQSMAMYFVIESTAMFAHLWSLAAQQFLLVIRS